VNPCSLAALKRQSFLEKPLLILDLDETLIRGISEPLGREPQMKLGPYFIYFRPHVIEFLSGCARHFELAVWSSATITYVGPIVRALLQEITTPAFVWDRTHCTIRYDFHQEKELYQKDLRKLSALGRDLSRVLIVDDEQFKVSLQIGNAILVKPYLGELEDLELFYLYRYLDSIAVSRDFYKLDKFNWRDSY
jgi:carboxy-terminal domain RNA polymerase II polypeptide A small phosphatase